MASWPCLEGAAQCDDVGVEDSCKDFTLRPDIITVVSRQDALLAHHLHGIHLARALASHLEHLLIASNLPSPYLACSQALCFAAYPSR